MEDDDDDDDLEDLDLDKEIITEDDDEIFNQSDINSSDLERMQSRIFASSDSLDDNDTTEEVRLAMKELNKRGNKRANLFNSEQKRILAMDSPTDEFVNRPVSRNIKYNDA